MRKKFTLSLTALTVASAALATASFVSPGDAKEPDRVSTPPVVAAPADDDAVTFYGTMERNTSWGQTGKVGFYSFTDKGPADEFISLSGTQTERLVTGGGAYYDGKFYYINGWSSYISVTNQFRVVDTDTWQTVKAITKSSPTLTDSYQMAFDYSTMTMYAICPTTKITARYICEQSTLKMASSQMWRA